MSLYESTQDPRITRHFETNSTTARMAALSTAANSAVPASATTPTSIESMREPVERESEELLMMFSTSPDRMTHSPTLASSIRGDNVWLARAAGAAPCITTTTVMNGEHYDERYRHTRTPMPIVPKSTAAEMAGFSGAVPISALMDDDHNDERYASALGRSDKSAQSVTIGSSLSSARRIMRGQGVAEPVESTPSTPTFEFSPPLGKLKTRDISFSTQRGIQINSDPRRPSPQSLDSTYSYDSYVTGLTSPATSFHDDEEGVGASGSYNGEYKERMGADEVVVDKGKGKATQFDEVVDSSRFATPPSSSRSPPPTLITPPSTSFSVTNQHSMVMLSASPEGLSHYSPDVADLLHMPPYELERKAFDWDEFERSLRASPGAGTSSSVTPFLPIDSLSGGLGLMLASSSTGINHVDSLDSPEDFNVQIPGPSVAEGTENRDEPSSGAANTVEQAATNESLDHSIVQPTLSRDKRHAVSMFAVPASGPGPSRTVTHRKSLMLPESANRGSSVFARGRIDSIDSASQASPSRPYSAGASPRGKKRSLILPSWLSKSKESKAAINNASAGSHDGEGGRTTHGSSQRRRLYKDKGRAHTAPVTFPFVVTPEAILNAAQPRPGEVEDNVLAEPPTIKPLEVVSLFETMLPQETKLLVMGQLVISHQEEFEQKVKEGKWSVAHAKGTRWVGKDAGMRELIKLTRVSKSWENITLDGQLWHSVDLKAFPGLSNTLLLKIARRAGSFVHTLSLQGYTHLKSSSVIHISSYFSINPQFNQNHLSASSTTQLTTINLVGCTSITTHSLHYLLLRSPRVKHLFLRGLDSVTNTTLTEIVGPRCRNLLTLDIRRCSNANGTGLMSFAEQCKEHAVETDISCRLKTLKIANMKGTTADVMRLVGEAFPLLEVLDASYCKDLADEGFRAFVEWPTPSPEIRSGLRQPEDWTRFSQGIELTSREAGFDPGDPTKYWRRITGLRHLNLSGCRHIGGGACSVLAYSVPKLEFLELAGVGGEVHDDGLIKLLQNAPLIRKLDLEDATEITDAVLDCLTPEVRTPATSTANGRRESREEENSPQPGEMLEHFVISYAMSVTPEAMLRLIRGCKKLRVLEADNTRITGNVIREFVNRRRHRERGVVVPDGLGSEIVGTDCRGVSEGSVRDIRSLTRPRRGWRDWEARELQYEDGQSVGIVDPITGAVVGPLLGQDECEEKRVVVKSFHSWTNVDSIAEQRAKLKVASSVGGKNGPTEVPRWLTQWSLGRRSPNQSVAGSPEEREDRGCIVQ